MLSNRKKISGKYKKEKISLVAGAIMLIFVISPVPAFAADGGDEGLSKPILALAAAIAIAGGLIGTCLLYTSPSPRDATLSRMPSSA